MGAPRVRRWVARYVKLGLAGLEKDAPRGGRPRQVSAQRVIELTTQTQPEAAVSFLPDGGNSTERPHTNLCTPESGRLGSGFLW